MTAHPAPTATLDLGGITLTYVPDGEFRAEPQVAFPLGHEPVLDEGLDLLDENGMLVLSVGAVLLSSGNRRVLIDAGIGARTIPLARPGTTRDAYMRGGALLENLGALGVQPRDIDTVLLTHLHADHVGWLGDETGSDAPTFPNADYWLTEGEWRFWARPENVGDAIGPRRHELDIIASRRKDLVAGTEPLDGVFAVPTSGHTPGHAAFSVEGTAGRALIVGDAMHCPAEIGHPDLVWVGDHDPRRAVSTRIDIAERTRGDGVTLVAPHFPNSVFRREHPSISQATSSRRALM